MFERVGLSRPVGALRVEGRNGDSLTSPRVEFSCLVPWYEALVWLCLWQTGAH